MGHLQGNINLLLLLKLKKWASLLLVALTNLKYFEKLTLKSNPKFENLNMTKYIVWNFVEDHHVTLLLGQREEQ